MASTSLPLCFGPPGGARFLRPAHQARHDLLIDGFVDVDWPAHARGKDRAQPFLLRLGEGKRNDDFDLVSIKLRSWPVGLPDSLDELIDQMLMDSLSHLGRQTAADYVRRQAHRLFFHFGYETRAHPLPLGFGLRHDPLTLLLGLREALFLHLLGARLRLGPEPSDLLVMPGRRRPNLLLRLLASPLPRLLPPPVFLIELL